MYVGMLERGQGNPNLLMIAKLAVENGVQESALISGGSQQRSEISDDKNLDGDFISRARLRIPSPLAREGQDEGVPTKVGSSLSRNDRSWPVRGTLSP